jgi:hypothetical protein
MARPLLPCQGAPKHVSGAPGGPVPPVTMPLLPHVTNYAPCNLRAFLSRCCLFWAAYHSVAGQYAARAVQFCFQQFMRRQCRQRLCRHSVLYRIVETMITRFVPSTLKAPLDCCRGGSLGPKAASDILVACYTVHDAYSLQKRGCYEHARAYHCSSEPLSEQRNKRINAFC